MALIDEKYQDLSRLPYLDGIRAIAALMVMTLHFVGAHSEPAWIRKIAVVGGTGVDLFFVLSGFLITRILIWSKGSISYFRPFYARRALRIFPLYYGYLIVHFFVLSPLVNTSVPSFGSQWWSWVYLQNVPATFPSLDSSGPGHFWSLAVEEHFYLVWPLLVFLSSVRTLRFVLGGIIFGAPVLRYVFLAHGLGVFYFSLTRFDALAFGALVATFDLKTWASASSTLAARVATGGMGCALAASFIFLSGSRYDWLQTLKLSLIPATYAAFLTMCGIEADRSYVSKLLSAQLLRWIGLISYGLYVFHPMCYALVRRFAYPSNFFVDLVLCFGLTFVIAWLSFRFFESPILRLKDKFGYRNSLGSVSHPQKTDSHAVSVIVGERTEIGPS